jgi:hypothetical protein
MTFQKLENFDLHDLFSINFIELFQVDVVAGPDAYRDLPRLLAVTQFGNQKAINVILSLEVSDPLFKLPFEVFQRHFVFGSK